MRCYYKPKTSFKQTNIKSVRQLCDGKSLKSFQKMLKEFPCVELKLSTRVGNDGRKGDIIASKHRHCWKGY